ncbi:DUF4055 domain-containing protein [Alphaproteobacteria bacterium LSUCC0684]
MGFDDVARPAQQWVRLMEDLDLIHDLASGTRAMREAGAKWLPKEPAESWEAWRQRLNRSILFNGFVRTWQATAGHVLGETVSLKDAAPQIVSLCHNIDGCGMTLDGFATLMVQLILRDGAAYILVDVPRDGGAPYFVLIEASQMIGLVRDNEMSQTAAGGMFVQARLHESIQRKETRFGYARRDRIRVYEPGRWSIWEDDDQKGNWTVADEGDMGLDIIPLVAAEMIQGRGSTIRPPLMDLAWLNLAHWQSSSDQRHILHIARVPILFARGMNSMDGPVDVGPNRLIVADDPAAEVKFVEHSGAAIEAGRQDLIDLEDKMAILGLDLLRDRQQNPTATGQVIEETRQNATLVVLARVVKNSLENAFGLAAAWLGLDPEDAGKIVMPRRTAEMARIGNDADLLLSARQAGDISKQQFLQEIERRGVILPSPDGSLAP